MAWRPLCSRSWKKKYYRKKIVGWFIERLSSCNCCNFLHLEYNKANLMPWRPLCSRSWRNIIAKICYPYPASTSSPMSGNGWTVKFLVMYSCPAPQLHSAAAPPLSATKGSISVQQMRLKTPPRIGFWMGSIFFKEFEFDLKPFYPL